MEGYPQRNIAIDDLISDSRPIGDWPGRRAVDLDNMGDAGAWLDNNCDLGRDLIENGFDRSVQAEAREWAIHHIEAMRSNGYPLLSDFGGTEEETFQEIHQDFVAFLQEWRRLAIAAAASYRARLATEG